MKKQVLSWLTALAVAGVLSMPVASFAQANPNGRVAHTMGQAANKNERHPEIRRALRKLESAKVDLQKGSHDFGGHREKALDQVNNAINELNQALQYDKK